MSELLIDNRGGVRILTMNRPEKRNALNLALSEALLAGLRAAEQDESVRAIVLTGAGPAFCAGADLAEFKDLKPENAHLVQTPAPRCRWPCMPCSRACRSRSRRPSTARPWAAAPASRSRATSR